MSEYLTTTTKIIEWVKAREAGLPLLNAACQSRFFFHPHPTEKVFLFFHGFTAGPYQFEPMGEAFFQAGYNVLVPLLPGHGMAGDWDRDNPPPLPEDIKTYQEFAVEWLQQAQMLGKEVIVGGLSANAILATWLALEYPQKIAQNLMFAPYLSGENILVDFFVELLPIYYEWLNKDSPGNFGYEGFRFPALRLYLNLAQDLVEQVKSEREMPPTLIITSEKDFATNQSDQKAFFETLVKHQPRCWYHCFDGELNIPHTMMTRLEGNDYQNLLITMTKAFVESSLTWDEIKKIARVMNQGKTYEEAMTELNLTSLISPDLAAMMTAHIFF